MSLAILQKDYFLDVLLNSENADGLFKEILKGH